MGKRYSLLINNKSLKRIPRKIVVSWCVFTLVIFLFLVEILTPVHHSLDAVKTENIQIDEVHKYKGGTRNSSAIEIVIISGDKVYYYDCLYSEYDSFKTVIETDLIEGNVKHVTVTLPNKQSISDRFRNRQRVVALKAGDTVYYDLNAEKSRLNFNRIGIAIAFGSLTAIWLLITPCICLGYRVIVIKRVPKRS